MGASASPSGSREPGLASRPGPAGFDPSRMAMCRLIGVDFEAAEITLRGLVMRLPPLAAGNYVIMPQDEWLRLSAIATEARRAETQNSGSVHEGAGRNGIAQTPPESHP